MTLATSSEAFAALRKLDAASLRAEIRAGRYTGHTAGLAAGHLQVNLAILAEPYALDFLRFCQRNPKPCPLVGASDTGRPILDTLGEGLDVRRDAPGYNIYRGGTLDGTAPDISDLWRSDLVAFALGCSFTFEDAHLRAGIPLWHIEYNTTVPMFRTTLMTRPAGPFGGGMVVSMRAIATARVEEAVAISARFPHAHGSPVHIGDPAQIGIEDLSAPHWGDPAPIAEGQTPVFWACGVTPQAATLRAKLPLCITHEPGKMLITDVSDTAEIPILPTNTSPTGDVT
ncbi:MAG: putative hydro-lyase [Pseudomonadota bacterium]